MMDLISGLTWSCAARFSWVHLNQVKIKHLFCSIWDAFKRLLLNRLKTIALSKAVSQRLSF